MKFAVVAVAEAAGWILAHAAGGLKKGRVLTNDDLAILTARGVTELMAARLDADDVAEDEAAGQLAAAAAGAGCDVQAAFSGRANVHASAAGLVMLDEVRIKAFNRIHESITFATLRPFDRVGARQMLATVKIIPFGVPRAALAGALKVLAAGPLIRLQPFWPHQVGLIITTTPTQKAALVQKSERAIADRLASLGSTLAQTVVCEHNQAAVAQAIQSMRAGLSPILVFGAGAIVDRADVVPQGLVVAGGEILHLGMPVDPGNLLMLGRLGRVPVVGVPSCARSPKVNGFDWVLNRLCAGLEVLPEDIMEMGGGGLLAEIPSRPQPREGFSHAPHRPKIAAIVLAAGFSSRMALRGQGNKLLAPLGGRPLVAQTIAHVKASGVDQVFVVTGHEADEVQAALSTSGVAFVHNANHAEGLASSLRTGVAAARGFDAAFICLGDMPLVQPQDLQRMMAAFDVAEGRTLIAPALGRKLGNPILWGHDYYDALMQLTGDRGARGLLEAHREDVVEIAVNHDGIMLDADTPEALAEIAARSSLKAK